MEENVRHKVFKETTVLHAHCNTCNDLLKGDGSMGTPWKCSCGYWIWDYDNSIYRVQDTRPEYYNNK
jgi:hypothetical protein